MRMMPKEIELRLFILGWIFICFVACGGSSSPQPHDETVFSASFDSGNLEDAQYLNGNRFLVRPMPDYGNDGAESATWNGLTWWYNFSVTVPQEHLPYPIKMEIDASRVWGLRASYNADKVPVISCDGTNWHFASSWESTNYGEVISDNPVISDTLTCATTYVAMATPYQWSRMENFIESTFTNPYIIRHDIIGHTPEGDNQDALPMYYLLLSAPGAQEVKRNVIVLCGQHPGETTNSWMITGLIEFLLSDNALAQSLRQEFAFHLYPAVNPEGVKYGHYRITADSPVNPNRAWDTSEVHEVVIVRNHILSQSNGRADYFFDLHGSQRSKHFFYHCVNQSSTRDYIRAVAARHPNVDLTLGKVDVPRAVVAWGWAHLSLRSHGDEKQPPVSVTPEGSYSQGSWEGTPNQVEDWKALGAVLVQAIFDVEGL